MKAYILTCICNNIYAYTPFLHIYIYIYVYIYISICMMCKMFINNRKS